LFQVVLDTNVLVAALRSRRGASYRLISLLPDQRWQLNPSVPLVLEYEEALKRQPLALSQDELDAFLNSLCLLAKLHQVFFLWRPKLRNPDDDLILELAVTSGSHFIVTWNTRDFEGASEFGIEILTPAAFLKRLGEQT
jgi:putative PIN family toxin of toxin-antitoxin system